VATGRLWHTVEVGETRQIEVQANRASLLTGFCLTWSCPMRLVVFLLLAIALPASAADPTPEITRAPATPQAVGTVHTLRGIPEACARLEGMFTGQSSQPYKLAAVRTSPACQARARFVDADKIRPSAKDGWIFNDLIRVPNAACATQQAVVRVWRRPANAVPPKLDDQGRSRIYLQESVAKAKAGTLPPIPMYAATMTLEGLPCR
jgi:hypothetical protein